MAPLLGPRARELPSSGAWLGCHHRQCRSRGEPIVRKSICSQRTNTHTHITSTSTSASIPTTRPKRTPSPSPRIGRHFQYLSQPSVSAAPRLQSTWWTRPSGKEGQGPGEGVGLLLFCHSSSAASGGDSQEGRIPISTALHCTAVAEKLRKGAMGPWPRSASSKARRVVCFVVGVIITIWLTCSTDLLPSIERRLASIGWRVLVLVLVLAALPR